MGSKTSSITQPQLNEILKANATASTDQITGAQNRAQQSAMQKNQQDAALSQLLQGKQADQSNELGKLSAQEDYRQQHVDQVIPRLQELQKTFPNMAPSIDETGNATLHPIDTLDKELKRQQLGALAEDRQDRIKGREVKQIQDYYSGQGGKNYAQKEALLARAEELLKKGDPESLRSADLEFAQGQAANALTQQEFGALTSAHGAGNLMQSGAKNTGQILQNLPGGSKLGAFLGEKAANMQTQTPAEIQQKLSVVQHLRAQNRDAANAIRQEMQQRADQIAPSMHRHDPSGLNNVFDTLGARIPKPSPSPSIRPAASPASSSGKHPEQMSDAELAAEAAALGVK